MSLNTNGLEDWAVPDTVDAAAQGISVAAVGVVDVIDRASTKWNGLSGNYQTEHTADVLAAFASIQPHAGEVVRVADAGKAALETFAETVRDLIKRRATVLTAAATFANSEFTDPQGEPDDGAKAAEESRIQGLVDALVGDYIAAQQDCYNTLSGIVPELRDEFKLINGAEGGLVAGVVTGVLDEHIHRSPYPVPTGWRSVPPPDTFASLPFDHIDPNTGIRWIDDGTGKLVMVGTSTDPNIDRLNPRRVPTGFHQPTSLRLNTPDPLNPTRGINNVPGWAKGGGAALTVAAAGFTYMGEYNAQYNSDLRNHPDWSADQLRNRATEVSAVKGTAKLGLDFAAGAAGAAIGSFIPIPIVGTALGFAAGIGVSYLLDKTGIKDAVAGAAVDVYDGLKEGAGELWESVFG